ncbi:TIGR00282 family metallophosphoesterase [Thalassospiraceae bacterium LMO-JJ14]|nr:TIGR00282 family metallophosphoesterase [Thalassospiraceae bacterium LMO-JJ14]
MRILIIGDVVGSSGRAVLNGNLPALRERLKTDFVIVNGENAAHGFGITGNICDSFYQAGADCITTGNHVFDQRDVLSQMERDEKILRPINYPPETPGKGHGIYKTQAGKRILVANVMCRLFMELLDDPFRALDDLLKRYRIGRDVDAIIFDVHGEATSEKQAIAHYVDGRASVVVGTHTHVPTADTWVLPGGTAYQTDLGMTGDYDSVIGMKKGLSVQRFITKGERIRLEPAGEDGTLCGCFVVLDDKTGLAKRIEPVRVGARLSETIPKA